MSFLSTDFTFNNTSSEEMGVHLIRVGEDTTTQSLSSAKVLSRDHVKFKGNFYQGADTSFYTLSMKIMKIDEEEPFTPEDRMELLRLIAPDNEFHIFTVEEDFPGLEFIIQFTKIQFVTNPTGQGYYELEAESNHSFPFSQLETIEYDLSDNTGTTIIELPNNCNTDSYFTPNVFQFTLVGNATGISIKNLTNSGNTLSFNNLPLLETVAINSRQEIVTESGIEAISKFNFGYSALSMAYGLNRLEITGACIIQFQLQYPIQI